MKFVRMLMLVGLYAVASQTTAAELLERAALVASTARQEELLPDPQSFSVTTTGRYTVTLRDLATPETLGVLRAVVTRDLEVVVEVAVQPVSGDAQSEPASANFNAESGDYQVHILGEPKAGEAGGTFSVTVAPTDGGTALLDVADVVTAESVPGPGQSVLRHVMQLPAAGDYSVTITDESFAPTTTTTQAIVLRQLPSGVQPIQIDAGSFSAPAAGEYELIVIATASDGDLAGLYSIRIEDPSSAVLYGAVHPAGRMPAPTTLDVTAAAEYTLGVADLRFPSALASYRAAVVQGSSVVERVIDHEPESALLAARSTQIFAMGTASPTDGVGVFTLTLTQGTQIVHSAVQTVDESEDPATAAIYSFDSDAVVAGIYELNLVDLRFPAPLPWLKAAVLQGGSLVHEQGTPGTAFVTLQTRPARVLVATRPPAANGNGLFSMRLSQQGGQAGVNASQGVGGLFRSESLQIPAAGAYDITLSDLEFPAALQSAALALTQGSTVIAQILGDGTIQRQQLAAGSYSLHFLGQPALGASYGLYGLRVADAAQLPTVTLTATPAAVTSGQTTSLQWNAANATTCTASGGWSGAKPTSGTQASDALTAATTFTISCTGPGGSVNASASVTVNPPTSNGGGGGGGGGGSWGLLSLLGLASLLSARRLLTRA